MASIAEKRERLLAGWRKVSLELGPYQEAVDQALREIDQDGIIDRIWAHEHTVWKPDPDEIVNRLGWLHIADTMLANIDCLQAFNDKVRAAGYTHAVLLGMGGSSLAPELFARVFGSETHGLQLDVLDSTDPLAVLTLAERLDLARTLFIVASKSGTTIETLSFFKFFYNRVADALGANCVGEHFIAITDPCTPLVDLAREYDFFATFENDPNIGGRYSALSYFGLVPAVLVGVDVERLLNRAVSIACNCAGSSALGNGRDAAALLGLAMSELAAVGRDKLTLILSPELAGLGDWIEQLVAESTGKEGKGIVPVVGEPLGAPDVYGKDRVFVYLRLDTPSTVNDQAALALDQAVQALRADGHPVIRLALCDLYDLGEQFFLWEMATAIAGHRLGINPFDQPDVKAAKVLAQQMIAAYRENCRLPPADARPLSATGLDTFLRQARSGDYVALQAYVQPTPETTEALRALRTALRNRYRLATTVGYGPRFLHSTGQLHKGGTGHGLFIQLTCDDTRDAPIPDNADSAQSYVTFGVLKSAQALGDARALLKAGRRLVRFHLGKKDVAQALMTTAAALGQ